MALEISRRTLLLGSLAAAAGCSSSIKGSGTTSSGTIVIGFVSPQADPAKPKPFTYTTMFFFGVDQFGGCFVPMWERISTDKVVAGMFPNDADGNAFRGAWPAIIKKAGYTWVDGDAYTDGTTD